MTAKAFREELSSAIEESIEAVRNGIRQGSLRSSHSIITFTPQIRFSETPDHFIAELLGAKDLRKDEPIKIVSRSFENIADATTYINGLHKNNGNNVPLIELNSVNNSISWLTLCPGTDYIQIEERLGIRPVLESIKNSVSNIAIGIGSECDKLIIQNVDLLRHECSNIYYRHIESLILIKKNNYTRNEFRDWIRAKIETLFQSGKVLGVTMCEDNVNKRLAKDLFSLSEQSITERVLDLFIQSHSDLFANALNYKRALSQIELEWQARDSNDPQKSIPDFFMEREDGKYHILDLKKGFLGIPIVKGKSGRRRFIDYVGELIAQLSEYERYFSNEQNQKYAMTKYGISLSSELKLIGVVGGYYESDTDEIKKVLGQYNEKITIMSYFDLACLIREKKYA